MIAVLRRAAGAPGASANFPGRRHPQEAGAGAQPPLEARERSPAPRRPGGERRESRAAPALLAGAAVPATSPSTGCAPLGGSLESAGRRFPRPGLLNTLPTPTSGGAWPPQGRAEAGGGGGSPEQGGPQPVAPLRGWSHPPSSPGVPHPAPVSPPLPPPPLPGRARAALPGVEASPGPRGPAPLPRGGT